MNGTKTTSNGRRRLFAWVNSETHTAVKVAAARSGVKMQDWVAEAVREKLAREAEGRVIPMERRR